MVTDRNIFHEYSKPILLIGTSSGDGDELTRLAKSFVKDDDQGGLISLTSSSDKQDVIEKIESSEYAWPNVLIVDLKGDDDSSSADKSEDMIKSLYEDAQLLSIFVNVEGESTKINVEDTMVKYSDYETGIGRTLPLKLMMHCTFTGQVS